MPARLAALSMATWKRGWRTTLLERRASFATTCAGMSRHQMVERIGGISGGSGHGGGSADRRREVAKARLAPLEGETEAVGGGLRPSRQVGVVALREVDEPLVRGEVHRQELGMAVQAQAVPDDRVELA